MINIKPFEIPFKGTATKATILCNGYWIGGDSASFNVSLLKEVPSEKEGSPSSYEEIASVPVVMEGEDFVKWGKDDTYVVKWALAKLSIATV